ncbi:MAG: alginate O-acetyltransferase complex protein AlgI [Kiritimatiellia bacterium]|jgi:alginate O-acetyltransferase complex protein AlgI
MLFNSLDYLIFFVVVYLLYWLVAARDVRVRNGFLIVASYVFYGWWNPIFLLLIVFSSAVDYQVGFELGKGGDPRHRRRLLMVSLAVNLGLLGVFKYYNFFAESLQSQLASVGFNWFNLQTLSFVLPVGISFYTFQTMSYSIDVYRRRMEPTRDPFAFFAYVCFFPQLVAGPIERAQSLLPQFFQQRKWDAATTRDGLRQILWGFFKKIAIADVCAPVVNRAFDAPGAFDAPFLVFAVVLFAFQIYADFSGYSDIAIGTARLFGFDLRQNFSFPYFSRDIAEFWRRWHISLSTWFRDYVYIPLGGSRVSRGRQVRNVMIVFMVSGLWHGANWTFVIWGFVHALLFLPLILMKRNRTFLDTPGGDGFLPRPSELLRMLLTFGLVCYAWIYFRAASFTDALAYQQAILEGLPGSLNQLKVWSNVKALLLVMFMLAVEWTQRRELYGLAIPRVSRPLRWAIYLLVLMVIVFYGEFGSNEFIYFQF